MNKDSESGGFFKNFRLGGYFRELSIVVLGVAVTFAASSLITTCSVNRNIKENMTMIKIELDKNMEKINDIMTYIGNDVTISNDVTRRDIRDIPADTLEMYGNAISNIQWYSYTDDALEMMKSSSLMPHVKDKRLLLGIIRTYEAFGNVQSAVEFYNGKKQWALGQSDVNDYLVIKNGSVYDHWNLYLNNDAMRNFFYNCSTILNEDDFDNILYEIGKVKDRIVKTYGIEDDDVAEITAEVQ